LNAAGSHPVVRWQLSQDAMVTTWFAGLPRAPEPLWQVAQLPGATLAWLKLAGIQALVRWQLSQAAMVTTWPEGLPGALEPLWQVMHEPGRTPTWLKRAPEKVDVLWQDSQGCVVGKCELGITTLETRLAIVWQKAHCRGVPLNTPRTWQESQRATWWAPVSGKPVRRCSKLPAACARTGPAASKATQARIDTRSARAVIGASQPCRCVA
jgi:hypothetical protein